LVSFLGDYVISQSSRIPVTNFDSYIKFIFDTFGKCLNCFIVRDLAVELCTLTLLNCSMGQQWRLLMAESKHDELLGILHARFDKNMSRHKSILWSDVQAKLEANPKKLAVLMAMEASAGEPDVIGQDQQSGEYIFCDCSAESPAGRRSVCYDREGLESRKAHKPENNALDMAAAMGVELLTETQYRELQSLGSFDTKTSSWIMTPAAIRKLGGALFADRRYGHVFVYHNGAQSYYAVRAFRGLLRV
jgi:hypothetical protein